MFDTDLISQFHLLDRAVCRPDYRSGEPAVHRIAQPPGNQPLFR